tara:strand:- start:1379 stop:2191 length:813 start_codon:yes stop_codon:yes gene_type:complete
MHIEAILRQFPIGEVASVEALPLSYSHLSYRIKTVSGASFFVKQYNKDVQAFVKAEKEIQVWRLAAKKGLAPQLIHVDATYRFVVAEFIEAQLYQGGVQHQALLSTTLRQFHQLGASLNGTVLSLTETLMTYQAKLDPQRKHVCAQNEVMQRAYHAAKQLEAASLPLGLCHMDLYTDHMLFTHDQCYLIDFEYAQKSYRVLDFASLGLDDPSFLDAALIQDLSDDEVMSLDNAKIYLWGLSWFWYQYMYQVRGDERFLQQAEGVYRKMTT